jgi:hypothetical protein
MSGSVSRPPARWAMSVGAVLIAFGAMTAVAVSPASATQAPKAACPNTPQPEPGPNGVPTTTGAECL